MHDWHYCVILRAVYARRQRQCSVNAAMTLDYNEITPKWVATPFSGYSIVANETVLQASSQR